VGRLREAARAAERGVVPGQIRDDKQPGVCKARGAQAPRRAAPSERGLGLSSASWKR